MAERSELDPVRAKFRWLARYHNETLHELLPMKVASLLVVC